MDDWQKHYVTEILPKLIELTDFNSILKAILLAEKLLSKADIDKLESKQHGKIDKSYEYYNMLMTRTSAYEKLTKALLENGQSGAANLLVHGFIKRGETRPLSICGVKIHDDSFQNLDIMVQGQLHKMEDFFGTVKISTVQQIFRETLTEMEYYVSFILKEQTFELVQNTVPSLPPFYIQRQLSNRIKIEPSVFKEDCTDIFVFKGIQRYKLSEIAQPHFTALSTTQLDELTSRFILLEYEEDLSDILQISDVPIHLIKYEPDQEEFILEFTSKSSTVLNKFLADRDRLYITEEEFIKQQINGPTSNTGVCICDAPGMGKTFLLANIARCIMTQSPQTVVLFILLSRLLESIPHPLPPVGNNEQVSLLHVLSFVCTSAQHAHLLLQLISRSLIKLTLFLDGFDEIRTMEVEWTKELLKSITCSFPKTRIYITSRSHMRHDLETTLGVIAYDILPFTRENQVDFLTNYWSAELSQCQLKDFQKFATHCLEMLRDTLSEEDEEITGIPLLCQLIAEVYAKDATIYALSGNKKLRFKSRTIGDMYKRFLDQKISAEVAHSPDEKITSDKLKKSILCYALTQLFPEQNMITNDNILPNGSIDLNVIYRTGILQQRSTGQHMTVEFNHRTFAEYVVAEYVVDTLTCSCEPQSQNENILKFIFTTIFETVDDDQDENLICFYDDDPYLSFKYYVTIYFINNLIGQLSRPSWNISDAQIKTFCQTTNSATLQLLFKACFQQNVSFIFKLFLQLLKNCTKEQVRAYSSYFTKEKCNNLITTAIKNTRSKTFHDCVQLCTIIFHYDLIDLFHVNPNVESSETLLQFAVQSGNYEAVEYFSSQFPIKDQNLIQNCVADTYGESVQMVETKLNIVKLLLNKDNKLLHESPDILASTPMHWNIFKALIEHGVDVMATSNHGGNVLNSAMHASSYMTPIDYENFTTDILHENINEQLFKGCQDWECPIEYIIHSIELLPKTIKLLVKKFGKEDMGLQTDENLLFPAIRANRLCTARELVTCGVDCNKLNSNKKSLLHIAAEYGSPEIIKYVLTLGLNINCLDRNLNTPLHFCKDFSNLKYLVSVGCNIELQNLDGDTIAHKIFQNWFHADLDEMAQYLCKTTTGRIFSIKNKLGNTPLHNLLTQQNCVQISTIESILSKSDININVVNNEGVSLSMLVTTWCGPDLLECFIKLNADITATDKHGKGLLHYSIQNSQTNNIGYLISQGLDVNLPDNTNNTPLHYCNSLNFINYLLENGANLLAQNDNGDTFAHVFIKNTSTHQTLLIDFLFEAGKIWSFSNIKNSKGHLPFLFTFTKLSKFVTVHNLNMKDIPHCFINQKDVNGDTLLLREAQRKRTTHVFNLIELGADHNAKNYQGVNILHIATLTSNMPLLYFCIAELKMYSDQPDKYGNSPILLAARKQNLSVIRFLIKFGADPKCSDCYGHNLLHIGAIQSNIRLLCFSVEQLKLDVNKPDVNGNTPVLLAASKSDIGTICVLIYHGADKRSCNKLGQNILHFATLHGTTCFLQFCLKLGLNQQQKDLTGDTPSSTIAQRYGIRHVDRFLKDLKSSHKIDKFDALISLLANLNSAPRHEFCESSPNLHSPDKNEALLTAAEYCDIQTVRKIVELGASYLSFNDKEQNIFHIAAEFTNTDLVKYCVSLGLDPNLKGKFNISPIDILRRKIIETTTTLKAAECLSEIETKWPCYRLSQ